MVLEGSFHYLIFTLSWYWLSGSHEFHERTSDIWCPSLHFRQSPM